eukprot:scaffold10717_cov61-Phaeocystis_antarctica.AAC.3
MFLLSLTLDAVRGRPAVSAVRCTSCSMRHEAPPSLGGGGAATAEADSRRRRRWEAAAATLEATAEARRRFDHRAHLARLVGVYVGDDVSGALGCDAELLVAVQPDQGGRKLLFLDAADGRTLGFIELETQSAISSSKILEGSAGTASTATAAAATAATAATAVTAATATAATAAATAAVAAATTNAAATTTSALRGMLVADESRGKGYVRRLRPCSTQYTVQSAVQCAMQCAVRCSLPCAMPCAIPRAVQDTVRCAMKCTV